MGKNIGWELYAITDRRLSKGRPLAETMRAAILGGAGIVQLRDKEATSARLYREALSLRWLTKGLGVSLIVNDRLDIVLAVDADGIHLGQDDLPVSVARRLLGKDKIIGASVHTFEQAKEAVEAGADYLGVGSIYPTKTKDVEKVVGVSLIQEIKKAFDVPVIAIGGINPQNVEEVIRAGADGVAAISGLLGAENIEQRAKEIVERIERCSVS